MKRLIRNFIVPYLIFFLIVIANSFYASKVSHNGLFEPYSETQYPKHYSSRKYYFKKTMAIIYASNFLSSPELIDFAKPDFISSRLINSQSLKFEIIPPGAEVIIFTAKDPRYFTETVFQYKNIKGPMDSKELTKEDTVLSDEPVIRTEGQFVQNLSRDLSQNKEVQLNVCVPMYDFAFSEMTDEETPTHVINNIANRNEQFFNFKLSESSLTKHILYTGYVIKEKENQREQCFNIKTHSLKYYFLSFNLIRD